MFLMSIIFELLRDLFKVPYSRNTEGICVSVSVPFKFLP